jgi:transposase
LQREAHLSDNYYMTFHHSALFHFITAGMAEQELRERVGEFWKKNSMRGKIFTINHFVSEGCARSTLYSILTRLAKSQDVSRKPGSGGHNKKLSNAQRASIGRWLNNRPGVSLRQEARKYGVCTTTMHNIIHERGLECRKRRKAPQYTEDQEKRAKVRAGKLLRVLGERKIIMDDESYFKLKCDYLRVMITTSPLVSSLLLPRSNLELSVSFLCN